MPSTSARQRTFTPPLIVALVALLALAAVTIWVVLRDDGTVDAGESGAGNAAASADASASAEDPDPEPAGTPVDSSDGKFATTVPDGYADGKGVVTQLDGMVLSLYDTTTEDDAMPTHIIVASADDDGTKINDAVSQIQSGFEDQYDTSTEASDIDIAEIDGEPTEGWQSGDYKDGSTDVNSTQFAVVHDGKYYFFTVNSLPEHAEAARAALEHIMANTTWS